MDSMHEVEKKIKAAFFLTKQQSKASQTSGNNFKTFPFFSVTVENCFHVAINVQNCLFTSNINLVPLP